MARFRAGRIGSGRPRIFGAKDLSDLEEISAEGIEVDPVGARSGPDQDIQRPSRLMKRRKEISTSDLPKPAFEQITVNDASAVLGHDGPEPTDRTVARPDERFQLTPAKSPPVPKKGPDFGPPPDAS